MSVASFGLLSLEGILELKNKKIHRILTAKTFFFTGCENSEEAMSWDLFHLSNVSGNI